MKSTMATKALPTTQPAQFKLTASGTFVEQTRLTSAMVARRAYELFEARGSEHGHDCEDWFRAESELLTPLPATIVDTDDGFTVRAELPGFTGKELEVLAEPRRLIVRTKKQTPERDNGRAVYQGEMSAEMFRTLELPDPVDIDSMKATIENEVLQVTLAKVNLGKKKAVRTKAA